MNRFQFVADHQRRYGVKRLCTIVGVARSSCYYWRATAADRASRQAADAQLAARLRAVRRESDGTYRVPGITAELREDGWRVNHKRIARVMRTTGPAGVRLRRRHRTTIADPSAAKAPDLIGRDFTSSEPNTKYVGDITYLPLDNGKFLYLATVIDLASRRLAGWAIADHMRTELVTDALAAAESTRGSLAGAIMHTDHGAQYTSRAFRRRLPQGRRPPVHERRRLQRGQRTRRVLQRDVQTRDAPRPKALVRRAQGPPRRVPLAEPPQHQTSSLPPGTSQPRRLRNSVPNTVNYAEHQPHNPCPGFWVKAHHRHIPIRSCRCGRDRHLRRWPCRGRAPLRP